MNIFPLDFSQNKDKHIDHSLTRLNRNIKSITQSVETKQRNKNLVKSLPNISYSGSKEIVIFQNEAYCC